MLLTLMLLPALSLAGPWKVQVVEPPQPLRATEVVPPALADSISLQVQGTAGEVVAGSFVVAPATADARSLQVQWTALDGNGGSIDRAQVSIRVVKHWFQGGSAWSGIRADPRRVYIPELLLNDDGLVVVDQDKQRNYLRLALGGETKLFDTSLDKVATKRFGEHWLPGRLMDAPVLQPFAFHGERFRQLWVNVTIPRDAKPGSYVGRLQLTADGVEQAIGTIQAEVLPFELVAAPLEYAIYYRGKLSFRTDTTASEWKSPGQMLAELKDLREHQIENATIFQPDDRLELVEQVLSLREQAGFSNKKIYYAGFSVGGEQSVVELQKMMGRVRRLVELFKQHGATEIYFYGLDEATGVKLAAEAIPWSKVRDAGAKIFAAGKVADLDFLAAHAGTVVLAYAPDREVARRLKATGTRVLTYAFPQTGPEDPRLFRRNYGLELWRAGYDGAMVYAYQSAFGSLWNDFDDLEYRDHVFAYPTVDGAIDTLAWEGMREAVMDARYLATLERALDSYQAQPEVPPAVARAKQFLELLKQRGTDDVDGMRHEAATLLTALAAKRSDG